MGHYYFIQSVKIEDKPKKRAKISQQETLMEWKYEIPPMFFPLFSSEPRYENSLLYCKSKEGFENIKKMYDFLEKYRELAFDNPDEFLSYKKKIIDYLEESLQDYYKLDGTDVFLMTSLEDEFLSNSENCYKLMQKVNSQIEEAIKNDDIEAFLSIYTDARITHKSAQLRYFFNLDVYLYGYECLLQSDEPLESKEPSYYLNSELKPYGYDVEIIQNGFEFYTKENGFTHCFVAKNKENKKGVINSHNETLLAFEFDNIEIYSPIPHKLFFKATKDAKDSLYCISFEEKTKLLIPPIYDKIVEFIHKDELLIYLTIEKNNKKGIYSVYKNIEIIEPKYESILYSYDKENLFAFFNDEIIQYELSTTKKISLDFKNLETSIKYCESDKKAKTIFKRLKSTYIQEALNLIFKDKNEIDIAQKNYPNINFLEPKSILNAVSKLSTESENDINISLILYKAYKYHFENKHNEISNLEWGIINFYIAEIYYKNQNYTLAIDYAQIAKNFVPIRNSFYITVLQFICYNYFFNLLYEKSIDEGLLGLNWIEEQQNHYKNPDALIWVNNVQDELEIIANAKETISYYIGCSYFNLENPDYSEALKYIELSLNSKSNWNLFSKNYIKAISIYYTNKNPQEAIISLQEADKLADEINENFDDCCYIKYLLAFSYYHDFDDSQKALEKIAESLCINPYYKNSLELKGKIIY